MYKVSVEVKPSPIDGMGVFALQDIHKGSIVWQFTEGHDKTMAVEEFDRLDESTKNALQRIAYLSPTSGLWVMPPEEDPGYYTNHSPENYNTSTIVDEKLSSEPLFIANRDIKAGEEITNNYLEFDENTKPQSHEWL